MKRVTYILAIIITIITLLTISMPIYAYSAEKQIAVTEVINSVEIAAKKPNTSSMISGSDKFIQIGEKDADKTISQESMKDLSSTIYNVLLVLGVAIAVILGAILGIKFIIEGAEGKAEVKKALAPYIAGCVVVFGAFTIWKIVVTILQT